MNEVWLVFRTLILRIAEISGVLLLVSFLVFIIAMVIPGDVSLQLTGVDGASPENIKRIREELGLNDPIILRYFQWLFHAVQGDFGVSPLTSRNIWLDVRSALPVSLELAALSLMGALIIGMPIGILCAVYERAQFGQTIRFFLIILLSIPSFVLGSFFVFFASRYSPLLYSSIFVTIEDDWRENLRVMFLPSLALSLVISAVFAQLTRNAFIQELKQPYIITCRAYGFHLRVIIFVYALRAAIVQILTVTGLLFGSIVGGTVVTERVFSLPGLGSLMVSAIGNRDFGLAIVAILMVTLVYLALNLIIDLIAQKLDPRRKI